MNHVLKLTLAELGQGNFDSILFRLGVPLADLQYITEVTISVDEVEFNFVP